MFNRILGAFEGAYTQHHPRSTATIPPGSRDRLPWRLGGGGLGQLDALQFGVAL